MVCNDAIRRMRGEKERLLVDADKRRRNICFVEEGGREGGKEGRWCVEMGRVGKRRIGE